jgi:hypothetical protein
MSDSGPYRHVADLPAFVAMTDELLALRVANMVVGPVAQARVAELQHQVRDLVRRADGFATLLGARGWAFFDFLAPEVVDAALAAATVDDAEDVLVAHLSDPDAIAAYIHTHGTVLAATAHSPDPLTTAKAWTHLFATANHAEVQRR